MQNISTAQEAFEGIPEERLPQGIKLYRGKVRDVLDCKDHLIFATSDRISAFDRILGTIPGKGEILNQISLFWFHKTQEIVQNHIIQEISPRGVAVKKAQMLPVEIIVRGYLTGSAWRDYEKGIQVPGLQAPQGMKIHQKLPKPCITPTTKAAVGDHDEPISHEQIKKTGLVDAKLWDQVCETAFQLYAKGSEILAKQGLILVDTKYEFGLVDGKLTLADEIHTPDCSRFWFNQDYEAAFKESREPKKLDKEYLRNWLAGQGFTGVGSIPSIPEAVFDETIKRYQEAWELITGSQWIGKNLSAEAETQMILSYLK